MNYQKLFKTVKEISKKVKKPYLIILFDIIWCGIYYKAGYMDYKLFEMVNLNHKQRMSILTRGKNNQMVKQFNQPVYINYFEDKSLFNEKYQSFLHRDWLKLTGNNQNEFKNFIRKHSKFICKPIDCSCGVGIELIDSKNKDLKELYLELIRKKCFLIEEVVKQCAQLSILHPKSVNTIRIVTLKGNIMLAYLRIGNHENVVDNFNHGGLIVPIDVCNGVISLPAVDKEGYSYVQHPLTNVYILNMKIPKWQETKDMIFEACKVIPEIGYVGWDVSITNQGPLIIEGNDYPGHDIYALPAHRKDGMGVYPLFREILKKESSKK